MKDALFSLDIAADGSARRRFAEPFRPREGAAASSERAEELRVTAAGPLPAA